MSVEETGLFAGLGAAVATAIGSALTFVTLRRKASGRVSTTDANKLWDVLQGELAKRDSRITGLEVSLGDMATRLAEKDRQIETLHHELEDMAAELLEEKTKRIDLEFQLERAREDKRLLEARVHELELELLRRLDAAAQAAATAARTTTAAAGGE